MITASAKDLKGDVKNIYNTYRAYVDYWRTYYERGVEAMKFYGGDQWTAADLSEFQSKKRPIVTINMIASMVRQVTGLRTQERLQPKVSPEREGTIEMANIKTKLLYFILKQNHYKASNHDVQEDQVVCGRGWWEIYMDTEDKKQGELKLRHADWDEIVPDYMCQDIYCRDSRMMFRAKYVPRNKLPEIYKMPGSYIYDFPESTDWTEKQGRLTENRHEEFMTTDGSNVLVIERWTIRKDTKTNITDGKTWREVDGRIPEDVLRQNFGEDVVQTDRTTKTVMVETIIPAVSQDKIIQKKPAQLQLGAFPFVPATCYKTGDKIQGIVSDLIDEQKRTNKSFSQIIEILGYSAKGNWLIKEGSVDESQFDANAARPGGKLFWKGDAKPEYIETAKMSSGYSEIFKISGFNFERISGIIPAIKGVSEYSGESGIKFAQKLQQAREQLSIVDKRFIDAFNYVCKLLLKGMPQVYDYEFAFQVLEGKDQIQDIKVNQGTIYGIMNDVAGDTAEYDVNVEQIAETATMRQESLMELAKVIHHMPQVAGFVMGTYIRGTDIENKDEIADRIELLSGQTQMLEQAKMQIAQMTQQQGVAQGQAKQQQGASKQERDDQLAQAKVAKMASDIDTGRNKNQNDQLKTVVDAIKTMQGGGA